MPRVIRARAHVLNTAILSPAQSNSSYQSQSSIEESSLKEQMTQKEDIIECLQAELVKVRLREAENDAVIRDLRARIHELEEVRTISNLLVRKKKMLGWCE